MKPIFKLILVAAFLTSATPPVSADESHHAAAAVQEVSASAAVGMSEGEVKKIDKEAGKITIRHGELKNLGMPPMTMIFRVTDKSTLEEVKPGDNIQFVAEKLNGKLTVTRIARVQ